MDPISIDGPVTGIISDVCVITGFVIVGGALATSGWVGVDVAAVIGSVDVGVQAATPTIIKPNKPETIRYRFIRLSFQHIWIIVIYIIQYFQNYLR
jgi:hypothetical protein